MSGERASADRRKRRRARTEEEHPDRAPRTRQRHSEQDAERRSEGSRSGERPARESKARRRSSSEPSDETREGRRRLEERPRRRREPPSERAGDDIDARSARRSRNGDGLAVQEVINKARDQIVEFIGKKAEGVTSVKP